MSGDAGAVVAAWGLGMCCMFLLAGAATALTVERRRGRYRGRHRATF